MQSVSKFAVCILWLISCIATAFAFQAGCVNRNPHRNLDQHRRNRLTLQWASIDTTSEASEDTDSGNIVGEQAVGAWIPIGSISALRGLGPQRITVMGVDLVVWEDTTNTNTWAVQADVCPHRLAPLSQGRVDPKTNCIECPYHGWQFDNNGTLSRIPQLEKEKSVESLQRAASLSSFPVHTAGDALFAFLPSSIHGEMFPQSILPEHIYPSLRDTITRNMTCFVRELPYSFDFLVENFMDPAHIPFAHHSLQSLRSDGGEIPMEVLVSNFTHLEMSFKDQVRGKKREGILSFQRPTMYHFRTLNKATGKYGVNLNIHVVPVRAGWSRVLLTLSLGSSLPKWIGHAFSNRFLNSDAWLHDAEIVARSQSQSNEKYVYATNSDTGTRTFRKWWRKHGLSMAPPNTFGPAARADLQRIPRRDQINPWDLHAKQCVSCRKALEKIKTVETLGWVVAIVSVIALRSWPVRAAVFAALSMYTSITCTKLATVIEGNPHPSGYADRSSAHQNEEKRDSKLSTFLATITRRRKVSKRTTFSP